MGCNSSGLLTSEADGVLSLSSHPSSTHTRILQDEVVDRVVAQPAPEEPKSEFLAIGDFIDGMLGLCDKDITLEVLTALPLGELFEDQEFPADTSSLSFSHPEDPVWEDVEWKRPQEISEAPYLFVNGTSRSDVKQGMLGNCWFLSACAAVAKRQDLIEKVIDPSQKLFGEEYRGILLVNFWRFGEWVTVHIDDRLPVRDDRLLYASCSDPSEYWLALIEKAFAKLHGSYEALGGGHALEAFVDLTGGIAERMSTSPDMFRQLKNIHMHGAFITCARKSDGSLPRHAKDPSTGLVQGHAYTVTSLASVLLFSGRTAHLVRLRNPWGDAVEWEGAWSDRSDMWDHVTDEDKERLRVTAMDDGEFWMEYDDFQEEFQDVTVATIGPDFNQDGLIDSAQQVSIIKGSWKKGFSAGGSRNDLEMFSLNPQYLLSLQEVDGSNKCEPFSIIAGLMQEHRRSEKHRELPMLPIALLIYKTDNPEERLGPEYFLCVPEVTTSGDFTNSREVLIRTHLEPGHYVIIPATFYSDWETTFMIRVFSLKPFVFKEIPHELQTVFNGI